MIVEKMVVEVVFRGMGYHVIVNGKEIPWLKSFRLEVANDRQGNGVTATTSAEQNIVLNPELRAYEIACDFHNDGQRSAADGG